METMLLQPVRTNIYPSIITTYNSGASTSPVAPETGIMKGTPEDAILIEGQLPFIEANTREATMQHLKNDCVVPVFSKDNEVTISHPSFIETVWEAANQAFPREEIEEPSIRVSHVIKGRTPDAIHKPVKDLLDEDKTIYYERMMFCIQIPSIHEDIEGNRLNLTVGGVRAYNHENLYSKKGIEKFKVFIGFKNMVCCNMCVSTDGYKSELKVTSVADLFNATIRVIHEYNAAQHLHNMATYKDCYMTESQFAQFLGKSRMYQFLPSEQKKRLPSMLMTDTQIGLVAKAYYNDENFAIQEGNREISMWRVYNLLTGANKSSYIDNFIDRALNATQLTEGLNKALNERNEYSWFIQ
ncbi:DUF3871 family protein [Butyricimonas sp. DFI.6.44]|uniref:DUF3871 family protein n=2 Tax=Odoribacteraceae TaxID=1853231 RepID=A0ABR7D169_9BACT|nr:MULTISPECIES: DUF3871 family protein [Butyricimonas]MBC5621671.1 DUF3871 family protein [Butyricimonas hominis]MCB6972849.1 DUF3871 family protein [Butyricimonas synergistica]MCG4518385.1 DUF3871 family protein [Butyricimonas sp. DFI.6.44]